MAEKLRPPETEATLTMHELHYLSASDWFPKFVARFDIGPGSHPDYLRIVAKFFRQLAAEAEGYVPLAEVNLGRAQAAVDQQRAWWAGDQQPENSKPARVLSMVTNEGDPPEEPPAS